LFPGTSETDQIYKIFAVLGIPTQKTWPDGIRLANKLGIRFPNTIPSGLAAVIPNASQSALNLISNMLKFDPSRRPSASQALQHEFFQLRDHSESGVEQLELTDGHRAGSEPGLDDILDKFMNPGWESAENAQGNVQAGLKIEGAFSGVGPMASTSLYNRLIGNDPDDLLAGL
jgi:serine/threonine protein kinase